MFGNLMGKTKSKVALSIPHSRKVRGYVIRRMPLGAYITAMQKLQDFPQQALELLFPGMKLDAVLAKFKTIDTEMLGELAVRAVSVLPKQAAALVSALTEIPEESLLNDPAIGLDGLLEIVTAWIEENNIKNFISAARDLVAKVKTQAAKGSSNG